ncbi:response regulator transcription factor [Kineosporia rhizophila]|uniref:response regulator n=1 Tax=Kineosporia TaxID=49184 RepID=UPI001E3CDB13|nr:response regulator transcription factor [Kineosporia sp. NBRC 101677]MCE0538506.1 response regulator transcription factor [Kineosporia rhizophila]GLY18359.1 DNA-binding response regulator [Kineosporia sp. NBRC 101677]
MISVLLVDDQQLLRMGFRMILDAEDDLTVVGEAADGRAGVTMAAALKPDIVLMDVRMPGMDGISATEAILKADPQARVLILTTFDVDEYVYAGLRAGASGFLLKDAPTDELISAIRTVAGGESVLAPTTTTRLISRLVTLLPTSSPGSPGDGPGRAEAVLAELTDRERQVFLLVAAARSNREIAAELHLSEGTVKIHVGRILNKLGLRDRVQAVVLAYESGLVVPDRS